jgi:glutamate racemase
MPLTLRSADSTATPDGPLLVLDSGVGGLTVAAALRRRLPHEDIVYVGDTARVPYGSKSPEAIEAAALESVETALARLAHEGRPAAKHLVVACNSASAVALPALRARLAGIGVSGVIDPGARSAAAAAGHRIRAIIGVIATEATVRSRAYEHAIARRRPRAAMLIRSTPLLVPLAEEGRPDDDPVVRLAVEQYLAPMLRKARLTLRDDGTPGRLDALVLGCTHYPILKPAITGVLGPKVAVIDSAEACAEDVARRLTAASLLRPAQAAGTLRLFATDLTRRFGRTASRFLGHCVTPELLPLDPAPSDAPPLRRTA